MNDDNSDKLATFLTATLFTVVFVLFCYGLGNLINVDYRTIISIIAVAFLHDALYKHGRKK